MHSDELEMRWFVFHCSEPMTPREAGAALGIPPNRVRYYCEKWARRGEYDWGVCVDTGWPTGKIGAW